MDEDDNHHWHGVERAQMREHLARAADYFEVTITGEPVEGQYHRSSSVLVQLPTGAAWLRVGREYTRWIKDVEVGDFWTGIPDSDAIANVPKPRVLNSTEWDDSDGERRVRADLMTMLSGHTCSPTDALRTQLDLPESWWIELRRSIGIIRATPTTRYATGSTRRGQRMREIFGDRIADTFQPATWETAHGDLHWSNVLGPELGLLDWELWGQGPAGCDPASLYLFSMLVPEVCAKVHSVFADVLDSYAGHTAQLAIAGRILWRARQGENLDLAEAVQRHVTCLVGAPDVLSNPI